MTYLNFSKAATMAALFIISSCIFDAPNDQFYRTRWTTSEAPFEGLIIEFKCDGYISASSEYDSCMLLGRYEPSGNFIHYQLSPRNTTLISRHHQKYLHFILHFRSKIISLHPQMEWSGSSAG